MTEDIQSYSIQEFVQQTAERDHPGDIFELESPKMLEAHVNGSMWSKLGAMIAYRGQLEFKREGMLAGGIGKALMKMVSGEMSPLTEIKGRGKVYLADQGKQISILRLQPSDAISVSGKDLLAFENSIQYAITMHRKVAGMMSGGLFSARLTGTGLVAIMSHGRPLTLRVTPDDPVITDPNATVAWSGNLSPELRTDINLKTLLGRGGGETFQMVFRGDGFVVVQPYEESPVVQSTGG